MEVDIHQVFANYFKEPLIRELAYECSVKLSEGHICVDIDAYNKAQNKTISESELLKSTWCTSPQTIDKEQDIKPFAFIINNKRFYLQRYFLYENEILDALNKIIYENKNQDVLKNINSYRDLIERLFETKDEEIDWQKVAVINGLINPFSIISGGPGTGKTTCISKLLHIYFNINAQKKVALLAPTGKAAVRIKESLLSYAQKQNTEEQSWLYQQFETQIENATIHRFLGYKHGSHYFKHNKDNPVKHDLLIVDEASMIGISLMSKLLQAIGSKTQVILLGDKNQLSSVEAGSIFGDLCYSNAQNNSNFSKEHAQIINSFLGNKKLEYNNKQQHLLNNKIVELHKSYRFNNDKGIAKLSKTIIKNKIQKEDLEAFINQQYSDVHFHNSFSYRDIAAFAEHFIPYIKEEDPWKALKLFNRTRILAPFHKGTYGVDKLNDFIQQTLVNKGLLNYNKKGHFFHNQVIIINKNNYNLELFNGDIGLIRKDEKGQFKAYFENDKGSLKTIDPFMLSQFDTVFAMTIHKSQGSEFDKVALIIPEQPDTEILSKELIYTALTRAKKELHIFSKIPSFLTAANKNLERISGISERLFNINNQ